MTKKFTSKTIGNIFIFLGIVGFLVLFSPLIVSEFKFRFINSPPVLTGSSEDTFMLDIPKIKVSSPVTANVNPWDKQDYQKILTTSIAHASGSALPNQQGSTYIFAHSSANPWELLQHNPEFYRLGRLEMGDDIFVTFAGTQYQYRVDDIQTVSPTATENLVNQLEHQLILQTCTPIGTDWNRLLVFAKPV